MSYTRFEVQPRQDGQFGVFNVETQALTRSRFHTADAAHEWILRQTVNHLFSQGSMPGRYSAPALRSSDCASENERRIRRLQGLPVCSQK